MSEPVSRLFHYTTASGLAGILSTMKLKASTKATSPRDARYGDGQYLTDIVPGTKSMSKLSRVLIRSPFGTRRFTHYIEIAVADLTLHEVRKSVFLISGTDDLDLADRIAAAGQVSFPMRYNCLRGQSHAIPQSTLDP